jgi:ribosome-associated protein
MSDPEEVALAALEASVRRLVRFSFAKSGGKGGQNVNKVSTKVLARVDVASLDPLSDEQKERVRTKLATRISEAGELAIFADDERSQARNRELAIARLVELIAKAAHRPRRRLKTRPPRRSKLERLDSKKRRGRRKIDRRPPPLD